MRNWKAIKSINRKGGAAVFIFCLVIALITACGEKSEMKQQDSAGISEEAQEEDEMKDKTEPGIQAREYYDIAYDTLSQSQKLDLYLPETGEGPFPLIMFIHGGGWSAGD